MGASIASASLALWIIVREAHLLPTPRAAVWILLAILFAAPTGALLLTAQSSWILWGPLTWAWAAARRGRCKTAAVVLGVATSVKPFLGLCVLAFAMRKHWANAAIAAITTAAGFLVGITSLGWTIFRSWLNLLRSITWAGHVFNASWFGVLERLLTNQVLTPWRLAPLLSEPAWVVPLWIVGAGIVLGCSTRALGRRGSRPSLKSDVDRTAAVTLSAAFLISPLAWSYYLFWLAGPFVALFASGDQWKALGWRQVVLLLSLACCTLSPGTLTAGQPNGWATSLIGSAYFWGLAGLWFCTLPLPGAGDTDSICP